jgi:type II secretion system protein G
MLRNRKGFTLIELLIVVVIIGILAAIAIPKFANTKDKAKLASLKTDLRNIESTQEAYLSDSGFYSSDNSAFQASQGNTIAITNADSSGYTATVTNNSISSGNKTCHVDVGSAAATTADDGVIMCP